MDLNENSTFIQNKYFIQNLYDAETLTDKFSLLEKEITNSGFCGALYTFIPKLTRLTTSLQPVFQHTDSYQPIINYYHKNDFSRHDFIIRLIEEGILHTIDWWEEANKMDLSKKEQQLITVVKETYGITKGFTFPTLSNDLGYAAVSIISFEDSYTNKTVNADILEHLKKCSRLYHDHAMIHQDARYKFILPILKTLTPKKIALIRYLISGKPMKNISKEVDISTRYAEKLLIEIRKQFGNISTNELIYLLGLLNIPEYI
ncbi:autoinducer binding domain-containing protein [uncultured Cocleimonas sp.]|uniref:helix-turn-helix transcriptional regulator n=1 Tax=uncultured Cocleimonas sp. TaxID=1051587 RepID=UPI002604A233|nr:autoinducer binding domain-containing protein [uncultured Cocleimonas sp.]